MANHEGHAPASRFALILMRRGERERAQSLLRQELDAELGRFTDGTENPQSAVGIAGLHALLGNVQEALDWRGYGMGYRHARWLERDPVFDAVRTEERFVSLFEKMHADVTRMRTRVDLSGLPGFEP
jgi:hypothetical protein